MQRDYCYNGLALSWKQVAWNRWTAFEQRRIKHRGINRAAPNKADWLSVGHLVSYLAMQSAEGCADWIWQPGSDRGKKNKLNRALNLISEKKMWCIWQHVWQLLGPLCRLLFFFWEKHKGFADSSVPSLSLHLHNVRLFFCQWAAEATMLRCRKEKYLYCH